MKEKEKRREMNMIKRDKQRKEDSQLNHDSSAIQNIKAEYGNGYSNKPQLFKKTNKPEVTNDAASWDLIM